MTYAEVKALASGNPLILEKFKVEISNLDEIGNIYKIENMLKSFENKINTVKMPMKITEMFLVLYMIKMIKK